MYVYINSALMLSTVMKWINVYRGKKGFDFSYLLIVLKMASNYLYLFKRHHIGASCRFEVVIAQSIEAKC